MLDFWQISTSGNNRSGTIEKLDSENMGIAVGILLLSALELEKSLGDQITPTCQQKFFAGTRVKKYSPK